MLKLSLPAQSARSEIIIEKGIFGKCKTILNKRFPKSRFAVITDKTVEKIYGKKIKKIIPRAQIFSIQTGEKYKNLKTIELLANRLLESGFGRADVVIGLGGGTVTDLAGFLASVYLRGVKYISIPTTLLGMADASVGGKTGVDLSAKNIIGSFYIPELILMDPDFLLSFTDQKSMSGFGEVIKYAAITDKSIFRDLDKRPIDFTAIIRKSVEAKIKIVKKDFREKGVRKLLNFGHTFGHAIETASKYKITHDQAISIGMVIANRIARKLGKQDADTGNQIKSVLKKLHLPTELPKNIKLKNLVRFIGKDKKRNRDKISFIIVPKPGKAKIIELNVNELIKLANK